MNTELTSSRKLEVLTIAIRTDEDMAYLIEQTAKHIGIRNYQAYQLLGLAIAYNENPQSYQ